MSDSSRTPPKETRTYLRPKASAMLLAMEVFPTPGGPTKRRMGPLFTSSGGISPRLALSALSLRTARYSRTRSFTFSRP